MPIGSAAWAHDRTATRSRARKAFACRRSGTRWGVRKPWAGSGTVRHAHRGGTPPAGPAGGRCAGSSRLLGEERLKSCTPVVDVRFAMRTQRGRRSGRARL